MLLLDSQVEPIVLRESIRARITVAPISILGSFLSIVLFIPLIASQGVTYTRITLWAVPILVLVVARGILSRWINEWLDAASEPEIIRSDRALRISSIANQAAVGMGIWIVQPPSAGNSVLPLFMTLIAVIWSIGVMANLFSDFKSFIMSLPFLLGPVAGFWLLQGGPGDFGVPVGISMLLAMVLMVMLVHRGTSIFRESVLIRSDKDELLERVEVERQKTGQALLEAQAANASKAYFMAAARHDIKQPLYALGMITDTLLMSDPPESTVPLLKSQRESIARMSEHFDALMDMDRYRDGQFELNLTRIRLPSLARRIDPEIAPLCAEKGLVWNLDVDEVSVVSDVDLLLRLMRNLLTNAVRYTDVGQVEFSASVQGDHVEFLVSDTGCGIAIEQQQAVFREFVSLDQKEVQSTGVGLGLSIVEKINRALDLSLKMSSVPGAGSRFSFRLPVAPDG